MSPPFPFQNLLDPVAGVTADTLRRHNSKGGEHRLHVSGNAGIAGDDSETACRTVHARAGILHPLWHELGDIMGAMSAKRRHAKPFLCDPRRYICVPHTEVILYLLEGGEVIKHVGEGMLDHRRRKLHELPAVRGM